MDVMYPRCCGLDVHKKTVAACCITSTEGPEPVKEIRTFRTMTADLLALTDWLQEAGCTHVAMESTGVYWRPVYNLLEGQFELLVVNAQHIKTVPGRKTDVKDADRDCGTAAPWPATGEFYPLQAATAVTRAHALSQHTGPGPCADPQSLAGGVGGCQPEARVRGDGYLWRLGPGYVGGDPPGARDVETLADLARGRLRAKRDQLQGSLRGTRDGPP